MTREQMADRIAELEAQNARLLDRREDPDDDFDACDRDYIPGCGEFDTCDRYGNKLRPLVNEANEPYWM